MQTDTPEAQPTQEGRTKTVGIAVTPSEKDALEIVAKVWKPEGGLSGLFRDRLNELVKEGERMLEELRSKV